MRISFAGPLFSAAERDSREVPDALARLDEAS
jgi:hypothetical protein